MVAEGNTKQLCEAARQGQELAGHGSHCSSGGAGHRQAADSKCSPLTEEVQFCLYEKPQILQDKTELATVVSWWFMNGLAQVLFFFF